MAEILFRSKTSSGGGFIQGRIVYSVTQSTNNNTSSVTATLSVRKWSDNNGTGITDPTPGTWTYSLIVDTNKTIYGKTKSVNLLTSWVELATLTVNNIEHNSNGTKNIVLAGYIKAPSTSNAYKNYEAETGEDYTISLPTIPRTSAITSVTSSVTVGNSCTVTFTPASSSYYYKIKFTSANGVNDETEMFKPGTTSSTSKSYTMSKSKWSSAISGTATSTTCTATLYTYSSSSGSSEIGSTSKNFTLKLSNSDTEASAYISATSVNAWNGYYIYGHSQCQLNATFSAGTGSYITSSSISGPGLTWSGTSSSKTATTSVLTKSGILTYTANVTDARGNSASDQVSITVHAYSAPKLSFSAQRTSVDGQVKFNYDAECSKIGSVNNLKQLIIYYKLSAETTWSQVSGGTVSLSSTSTSGSVTFSGFNTDTSYDFKARVYDTFGYEKGVYKEAAAGASSGFRLINIKADKQGIAFGKMSEDNTFDCGLPMKISSTTTTESDAGFNVNESSASRYLGVTKTIGSNAVVGQLYINDEGDVTLTRRYENTDPEAHAYLTIHEDKLRAKPTIEAQHGRFTSTGNVDTDNVGLIVGNTEQYHVNIDTNEVQAYNDSSASTLNMNVKGGDVYIGSQDKGSNVYINKNLRVPNGNLYVSNGTVNASTGNFNTLNVDGKTLPEIQRGTVWITPKASTSTRRWVTFPNKFSGVPTVMVTAHTSVPGSTVLGVGYDGETANGTYIYVTRDNGTTTRIDWVAVYLPTNGITGTSDQTSGGEIKKDGSWVNYTPSS